MFSKMMAGLRTEAERIGQSNYLMLMDGRGKEQWAIEAKINGAERKSRQEILGGLLGVGGITGCIGLAMANQASALGGATVLASVAGLAAGLGTVAIGSAVLPVAAVAALGTAAIGAAMSLASLARGIEWEKGRRVAEAVMSNDVEALKTLGSQDLSAGNWLGGALAFVKKSMRDTVLGDPLVMPKAYRATGAHDLRENYLLEDLLSESSAEGKHAQKNMVVRVASDVWDKHGVTLDNASVHACLSGGAREGAFSGPVIDVNHETGMVVQSLGRGKAVIHHLLDFTKIPEVGQPLDVQYKGGTMVSGKEAPLSQSIAR